jgi:hypothetical protein
VAGRRQIKPTSAKMVLTEAAANKKRKKAATMLPKAALTPLSRKVSPMNPTRGRTARPTIVSEDDIIKTPARYFFSFSFTSYSVMVVDMQ